MEGTFTYSIPDDIKEQVREGMRVLVSFGPGKTYVGVVASVGCEPPIGYKVKPILRLLDTAPSVLPVQQKLWMWVAEYYLSPIGEVFKTAMPSGLKQENGYKPRTELFIRLTPQYSDESALHQAIENLKRAPRQMSALLCHLRLSHADDGSGVIREVARDELLNASHSTLPVLNSLVKRGILETYNKEVGRLDINGTYNTCNIKPLSPAQAAACQSVVESMSSKAVTLLHGVTSSGKTEIYIHLIQREIEQGRQVLYLLPEIALTVQIMERLKNVFGDRLGIYHSKYSDAERVEIWNKQLSSAPYDIILGARSALFLPFIRLGLVIVDEEHEQSFKQQNSSPRYHARSTAIMLASMSSAKTLLGSATPSIDTFHNVRKGKYGYVSLTTRYEGIELPDIKVVDIADLQLRKMMTGPFSPQLIEAIGSALDSGRQVMLFQNRRGFSPMVECHDCGWVPRCKNCDVTLTLHKTTNQLACHYCGYTYMVPTQCPDCQGTNIRSHGFGTEKVEEAVLQLFPQARVARMDLDTTRTRNAYYRLISDFSKGHTDILIGTQMIGKGLDFGNVSVVGILSADSLINYPEFRSSEHAFMMMQQVSGRAGRSGSRGLVILQTNHPSHPLIRQVVANDYEGFYSGIIAERQEFRYPPCFHLIYIYLKHSREDVVTKASASMAARLRQWFGGRILGPERPVVSRVKALHIRMLMLKAELGIDMKLVRSYLRFAQRQVVEEYKSTTLQVFFDVDPE